MTVYSSAKKKGGFSFSQTLPVTFCICLNFVFTIVCNAQAVDDYRTKTSGNWNSNGTWERYNGISWVAVNGVAPNTIPTSSDGNITILNTHTVSISSAVTADQLVIDAGGQITVNSGKTLTIANGTGVDLTVNGTLDDAGTVTTPGTVSFGPNSTYTHSKNGGTIPTATWDVTSTCNVTGITGAAPGGLGQSFGNFTWNCTSQSSTITLNGILTTINGNFNVVSTGSGGDLLRLTNGTNLILGIGGDFVNTGGDIVFTNSSNADVTLNISGNYQQTAGSLDFSSATNTGVLIMNVTGNFSQSGGSFDFTSGGASTTRTPALNLSGNFSQSGAGTITTSTLDTDVMDGIITFNKSGTQSFSISTQGNTTYTSFDIATGSTLKLNSNLTLKDHSTDNWAANLTVAGNGALDAGTYQILSSTGTSSGINNDFILSAGASILTANVNGLQNANTGTVSAYIANRTFSSTANYTYNGAVNQNSGTFTTTPAANQVNNFTINNTGGGTGVTLQQIFSVAGTCYFTAGLITSTTTNLLIFNDNAIASGANNNVTNPSYVNGPVRKIGNDAFTFPVGKSTVGYMLCGISAPSNTTDAFTAEYKRNSASALGPITAVGLYRVSACEYWQLDRTTGTSNVNVTLSWSGLSPCNASIYVNSLASLVVAHFNGTSWNAYGSNNTTGNGSAGTVTWNNVSTFSPFTLGSTSAIANPLPIKFNAVKAYSVNNGNRIEWTNLTEENLARYEVERSANGTSFNTIITVTPATNNGQENKYTETDEHILSGINYYRIKAVQSDGSYEYSAIVKVNPSGDERTSISVYPNPVVSNQFTLELNNYKRGDYSLKLIDGSGQQIMLKTIRHSGGSVSVSIDRPVTLQSGVYILQITGGDVRENIKLIIK